MTGWRHAIDPGCQILYVIPSIPYRTSSVRSRGIAVYTPRNISAAMRAVFAPSHEPVFIRDLSHTTRHQVVQFRVWRGRVLVCASTCGVSERPAEVLLERCTPLFTAPLLPAHWPCGHPRHNVSAAYKRTSAPSTEVRLRCLAVGARLVFRECRTSRRHQLTYPITGEHISHLSPTTNV